MQIRTNIPLKEHSAMRLGGPAHYFATINTRDDVEEAVSWAEAHQLPLLITGEGSNIIFSDEGFKGLVAENRIMGFEVLEDSDTHTTVRIGAGEHWDTMVERTVDKQLYGIECLSAIPGTTGATPVQNVGAYGQEIADTFVELEAYNTVLHQWMTMDADDCQFGYRSSIFNTTQKHRYIITSVTLTLQKQLIERPLYKALQDYLDQLGRPGRDPHTLRQAVQAIRAIKLPDPAKIPNSGSFFKNAVLPKSQFAELLPKYSAIPHYDMPDGMVKVPSAWLIEQAGLKGYEAHGIRINPAQPLVLINDHATSTRDLYAMRDEIVDKVYKQFGVKLVQEPEAV